MSDGCCCKCCYCDCCVFFILFIKQFFDIGKNSGSLLQEGLNIFRTFQRLSATKSFSAKFSNDFVGLFQWARNIINLIVNNLFRIKPFTNFELFCLYSLVFPISILTFISSFRPKLFNFISFLLSGLVLTAGVGFGYIGINNTITIACCICSILAIIGIAVFLEFDFFSDNSFEKNTFILTKSLGQAIIVFICLITPFCLYRYKFQVIISVISVIIIVISFFVEFLQRNCCEFSLEFIEGKLISFFSELLSLLIVPSAEAFAETNKAIMYHNRWATIIAFIMVLIIPCGLILVMIISKIDDIYDQYVSDEVYSFLLPYLDLVDNIKQVLYAIFASYDNNWACIGLEAIWVLIIVALLPYKCKSNYFLSLGNSLVMFMSNGAALYADAHGTVFFSFAITLIFVIFACLPSIFAILVYFYCDFETKLEISDENEDKLNIIFKSTKYALPITFFIYGLNVSTILMKNN